MRFVAMVCVHEGFLYHIRPICPSFRTEILLFKVRYEMNMVVYRVKGRGSARRGWWWWRLVGAGRGGVVVVGVVMLGVVV